MVLRYILGLVSTIISVYFFISITYCLIWNRAALVAYLQRQFGLVKIVLAFIIRPDIYFRCCLIEWRTLFKVLPRINRHHERFFILFFFFFRSIEGFVIIAIVLPSLGALNVTVLFVAFYILSMHLFMDHLVAITIQLSSRENKILFSPGYLYKNIKN